MGLTSTIEVDGQVIVQWSDNEYVARYFAPLAQSFVCEDDRVVLPVTPSMIADLIRETEEFLAGVTSLTFDDLMFVDGELIYTETMC